MRRTEQILRNVDNLLREAGSDLDHMIKTSIFISNIDDFGILNETYKRYSPHNPPTRSAVQIGKFSHGMVIEVETVAVAAD